MMMFDGAGDSRDYLGAVQYSTVQYSTVQYSTVMVIAEIISVQCLSLFPSLPRAVRGPGCHGTGSHRYEHRTYRHMRHPRGG